MRKAWKTVLSRLRALSPRERVLLLAGAAALLVFALTRWVVYPEIGDYRKTRAAIPARRATLSRYLDAAGGREAIEASLAVADGRLAEEEKGLLPGDSPQAASAALQGIIKPWIGGGPDTRLTSIRTLAPVAKGPYSEVAVQVDLQTTTEGLARFLAQVPRQRLLLRIQRFSVSSAVPYTVLADRRELLTSTVVVAGMTGAPPPAPAAGGKP